MYCFMHMRGKTVCQFSGKMKIQVVSIFFKTNRLLYSTTILESTFRGITVGLALLAVSVLTVKSSLYYLEFQFGWQPTTFHRPQIYLLSYYIDFRQLRFDLQMKVNAGGCTHRDKLDVVSKYKFYRPCILIHACICAHA